MIAPGLHASWRALDAGGWRWPHFSLAELACKCGRHCAGEYWHDPLFLDRLEALRLAVGRPFKINCASVTSTSDLYVEALLV